MSKHPTNQISEGSRWRNKKSGVVSEVLRVEGRDVVLRAGRKGERRKLAAHFALDYEPAGDAEVRVRRPGESPEDTEIRLLRAKIAELETALKTAEQQRDEARANYAFMVERAADQRLDGYRELGAKAAAAEERAAKAERERDEARAERDALHVALELAEVDVALDRSWCRICRTECRGAHRGRREHMHATECVLNIRAHAAKAVKL